MKATIYNINLNPNSSVKARASVELESGYAVHGLKIIKGPKGLFVSMPSTSYVDQDGVKRYRDIFHPTKKESRAEINSTVLTAYKEALEQALQIGQEVMNEPYEEAPGEQELDEPEPVYSMGVAAY